MKDGFDKSVAERMPKIQKKRPNRPWNVDPVLMKPQEEQTPKTAPEKKVEPAAAAGEAPVSEAKPAPLSIVPEAGNENIVRAVETIKDISSDFTQMIFDRKEFQQKLEKSAFAIEEVERENARLKENLSAVESSSLDSTLLEQEIDFLNEQLEDADLYICNMVGLLDEKGQALEQEKARRSDLEGRYEKITREIHEKAKVDVKVSILERDLSISNSLVRELETKLAQEFRKREPLEQEIVELKNALERVYTSLAHIRLKAKREVYGS